VENLPMPTENKNRQLSLKNVPDDIFSILVTEQAKIKLEKRSGKFGLEQVIYKMVRAFHKNKVA
jgi:hypothetical protein